MPEMMTIEEFREIRGRSDRLDLGCFQAYGDRDRLLTVIDEFRWALDNLWLNAHGATKTFNAKRMTAVYELVTAIPVDVEAAEKQTQEPGT